MTARRRVAIAAGALIPLAVLVALTLHVTRTVAVAGPFDQSWHDALWRFAVDHPAWRTAMRTITHLGDTATVLVVDVGLFIVCLTQRHRRLAALVVVVGLGGWALRILLRDLVARPRPANPLWPAEGFSFPSGHTTNSTLMMALLVVVCWSLVGSAGRWALVAGAIVVAAAVGFSRAAGGVHWPTDVIAGWALALSYLGLVAALFPWGRATAPREASIRGGTGGRPAS